VLYQLHMAAKGTPLKEIGEMPNHVVKHMVTKDELARVTTIEEHLGMKKAAA